MEAQPAGSLLSFLAYYSRPSQPAWPTASPVGRSRVGVLRHHVWCEELHRHCAMGTRPRYWADASTWLHTPTSKDGWDSQDPDCAGLESLRGCAEPVGRIVAGPAGLEWSVATTSLTLDGKAARGSFDGLEKAVHLLSLVAQEFWG